MHCRARVAILRPLRGQSRSSSSSTRSRRRRTARRTRMRPRGACCCRWGKGEVRSYTACCCRRGQSGGRERAQPTARERTARSVYDLYDSVLRERGLRRRAAVVVAACGPSLACEGGRKRVEGRVGSGRRAAVAVGWACGACRSPRRSEGRRDRQEPARASGAPPSGRTTEAERAPSSSARARPTTHSDDAVSVARRSRRRRRAQLLGERQLHGARRPSVGGVPSLECGLGAPPTHHRERGASMSMASLNHQLLPTHSPPRARRIDKDGLPQPPTAHHCPPRGSVNGCRPPPPRG